MFLQSLELTGFKSFAKRTKLEFQPGITGIVGPNGSGKSNIADAIRWVLGAQSKKAVRGKVSTDVIFSGTSKRPAMSLSEVSLTFDNSRKLLPYDYDEVVVTRRLYRSGDSEYLVNGGKVRLTDLLHAFAVAGVGAENYTVISQGLVDKVLSQTPEQRRGLFEEAAGVRQFYLKRDEAKRKLAETDRNLGRVHDILKELGPRLKSLARQADALAKRAEVEQRLKDALLGFYGRRYRDLSKDAKERRAKREELEGELAKLGTELDALGKEVDALRSRQQGLTLNKLFAERNGIAQERDELRERTNKAITAREVAKATIERLRSERKNFEARLELLPEAGGGKTVDTKDIDRKIADVEKRIESLERPVEGGLPLLLDEIDGLVHQLEEAVRRGDATDAIELKIDGLRNLLGRARRIVDGEPDDAIAERTKLQEELASLKVQRASRAEATKLRNEQAKQTGKERETLVARLAEIKTELATAERTVEESATALGGSEEQLKELESKIVALDKQVATEQQRSFGESDELKGKEEALRAKHRTQDEYRRELEAQNLELAKLETKLDDLVHEAKGKLATLKGDTAFPMADDVQLPAEEVDEEKIAKLERRLMEMGGIDPAVTAEHQEVEERHQFLTTQGEDLSKAKKDLEQVIRELEQKSRMLFTDAFEKIGAVFSEYFDKLFGGGRASLELVEPKLEDVEESEGPRKLDAGIEIKAVPPGKRLKSLAQLSGGERALTSVALLFAILKVNPSPFVMLDEVDAALDEANTGRFASVLSEMGELTQFLVVTHNRDTMKAAAMLYGVSMDSTGVSTMLSLKLPEAEKVSSPKVRA
ncbi:MAG TPA: AAA family ATPase [Patescibacteria group bacterium]|jgi:chromosome segregation protein